MTRKILAVPLAEVRRHLDSNTRQDVKIVAPDLLSDQLFQLLVSKGKRVNREVALEGDTWLHSPSDAPNRVCASAAFVSESLPQYARGPFAVSFANERADQDAHYHRRHGELYYSEHRLAAEYWTRGSEHQFIALDEGGLLFFAPDVVHRLTLGGLTLVIELPSISDDKVVEPTTPGASVA